MAWHPFRNVGLKIVATVLATLLWLTVGSDPVVERSVRVPLVYRNVPQGLEIATGAPDSVEVNLRGRASEITGDPGDVSLSLDLQGARTGSRLYHLRTDQVTTPIGMEATQVFPGSVMLTLETTSERMAPVRPTVDGTPGSGYVVREIIVDPREVLVVGPMRALEALSEAITETVMIDGATNTVTRTVSVGVAEASLRLKEPKSARVTVVIVKDPGGKD